MGISRDFFFLSPQISQESPLLSPLCSEACPLPPLLTAAVPTVLGSGGASELLLLAPAGLHRGWVHLGQGQKQWSEELLHPAWSPQEQAKEGGSPHPLQLPLSQQSPVESGRSSLEASPFHGTGQKAAVLIVGEDRRGGNMTVSMERNERRFLPASGTSDSLQRLQQHSVPAVVEGGRKDRSRGTATPTAQVATPAPPPPIFPKSWIHP